MKHKILALILIGATVSNSFAAHPVERFVYGPSNKDPRVIALSVGGGLGIITGLLIAKKGIELAAAGLETKTPEDAGAFRYFGDTLSSGLSRILGISAFGIGGALTLASGALIISSKELITRFESGVMREDFDNWCNTL